MEIFQNFKIHSLVSAFENSPLLSTINRGSKMAKLNKISPRKRKGFLQQNKSQFSPMSNKKFMLSKYFWEKNVRPRKQKGSVGMTND